jgi:SAM-dependent methyltransferase
LPRRVPAPAAPAATGLPPAHVDPYRAIDAQADPLRIVESLEERGRTPAQARLRRAFLRFIPVRPGDRVLEVGCGTGVVVRDLAGITGRQGRVDGIDPSRTVIRAARLLARPAGGAAPITLRVADGTRLPFRASRFDVTLAVTVMLHLADPLAVVREMARVTRPGGRVALQDQDFGTVAAEHPDRALTARILGEVAGRVYEEPFSGRRLPGLLRAAGLRDIRLQAAVYQDTALGPYTRGFLERRAENAVRFGIVDAGAAQGWLDGFTRLWEQGTFVLTMNYFGAVGVKPEGGERDGPAASGSGPRGRRGHATRA